jgi:hypothetical protein
MARKRNFMVAGVLVHLWPEEQGMLCDLAKIGTYPTAYTQMMQDLLRAGAVSRLEECGPNGTAVLTADGRALIDEIETAR